MAIENKSLAETPKTSWFEANPKKTLVFLAVLIILGLTLLTEKLLSIQGRPRPMEFTRYIRLREYEPRYTGFVVPDEEMLKKSDSLKAQKYPLRIDADGFTMPSRVHDDPDLTIFFLGGSTTACDYVGEGNRFPYLAGRYLEKACGRKINAYNAGRGGNDSLHSINNLLNKIIPLKPDLVVLLHHINDLTILLYERTYWDKNPDRSPIVELNPPIFDGKRLLNATIPNVYREVKNLERLFRKNVLSRFRGRRGDDEFRHVRGKTVAVDPPFLLEQFELNLQTFINICRARRITPVLMTMQNRFKEHPDPFIKTFVKPLEAQGVSYQQYQELFELFNQAIRSVGEKNRVLVIDLARLVPQEKAYMYDIVHFNDEGSQLAARLISQALQPLAARPLPAP